MQGVSFFLVMCQKLKIMFGSILKYHKTLQAAFKLYFITYCLLPPCIDLQYFGHFGNLVNQTNGSEGGGVHNFLTFDTSLNKLKHPNVMQLN